MSLPTPPALFKTLRLPLLLTALAATLATPLAGAQSLKELH